MRYSYFCTAVIVLDDLIRLDLHCNYGGGQHDKLTRLVPIRLLCIATMVMGTMICRQLLCVLLMFALTLRSPISCFVDICYAIRLLLHCSYWPGHRGLLSLLEQFADFCLVVIVLGTLIC